MEHPCLQRAVVALAGSAGTSRILGAPVNGRVMIVEKGRPDDEAIITESPPSTISISDLGSIKAVDVSLATEERRESYHVPAC